MKRSTVTGALFASATLALLAAPPPLAAAQDTPAGVEEARRVATCLHHEDTEMQRIIRLMADAQHRATSASAEDMRADAREALVALVQRAREISEAARACVTDTQIPVAGPEVVIERSGDERLESLARDHGTVHVVESDRALSRHVHVVIGERVDGSGTAPDRSVRAAVSSSGGALEACYESYVDRASRRPGEIIVVFTTDSGGRISDADVDRGGGFDSDFRSCVVRAARALHVSGQRGRSVYSYRLRFQ